jgi:hypothetical protein
MRLPSTNDVFPNYYAELGVPPDASPAEIQGSYSSPARVFHPDIKGSSADPLRMAFLERAYSVLSDRRKRSAYDLLRSAQLEFFILLLVEPTAHRGGHIVLFLLGVLSVRLVVSLATLRWEMRCTFWASALLC